MKTPILAYIGVHRNCDRSHRGVGSGLSMARICRAIGNHDPRARRTLLLDYLTAKEAPADAAGDPPRKCLRTSCSRWF